MSFRLGVRAGFLLVNLRDCAVVPGTRLAMRDQPVMVEREVKREETESDAVKTVGSATAKLRLSTGGMAGDTEIGGGASASRERARTTAYRQERKEGAHKVTARGTNTEPSWEIRDPETPILDGRYLGPDNLCGVAPAARGYQITARFACRRRDLALSDVAYHGRWFRSITKEKLALAVVASDLGKAVERLDEGMLTLCRSMLGGGSRNDDDR